MIRPTDEATLFRLLEAGNRYRPTIYNGRFPEYDGKYCEFVGYERNGDNLVIQSRWFRPDGTPFGSGSIWKYEPSAHLPGGSYPLEFIPNGGVQTQVHREESISIAPVIPTVDMRALDETRPGIVIRPRNQDELMLLFLCNVPHKIFMENCRLHSRYSRMYATYADHTQNADGSYTIGTRWSYENGEIFGSGSIERYRSQDYLAEGNFPIEFQFPMNSVLPTAILDLIPTDERLHQEETLPPVPVEPLLPPIPPVPVGSSNQATIPSISVHDAESSFPTSTVQTIPADSENLSPDCSTGIDEEELKGNTEGDSLMCVVCLDTKKMFAFVPCGHLAMCNSCALTYQKRKQPLICVICKQNSSGYFRVYF